MNKAIILGRLGQDPELKFTPSGAAVCNFSLATSEKWKDKDGQQQERTEWHRVTVWKKQAELCNQYLKKGSQCLIEGKIQTRSWDDKDGKKCYTTEIIGDRVQFLGKSEGEAQKPAAQAIGTQVNFASDDIPF